MKKLKKIMAAIDFSEHSFAVAEYTAGLAADVGANLLLTNIINTKSIDMMEIAAKRVAIFSIEKYIEEQIENRKKLFGDLQNKLNLGNLNVQANVRTGVPYSEILMEIKEAKPDLLVMGRKGRSELADMVIGSCAQKMFRRCPIPLLTI